MGFSTSRFGKTWSLLLMLLVLSAAGGCRQNTWPLWDAYKTHFIDGQGRVIDHSAGERTTSEGEAYAMFFALADNDRATFDRLLGWTQVNLAANDLGAHLPAWLWGKSTSKSASGEWRTLDASSAADADTWMAYTLLEAGRLWKSPEYTHLGRAMMATIAKTEVADLPGFGTVLAPGPTGFEHGQALPSQSLQGLPSQGQTSDGQTSQGQTSQGQTWTLNPSYMPAFLFERFAHLDPGGSWRPIAFNVPRLLEASARHGFVMDWVNYIPGDGFTPAPPMLTGNRDSEAAGGSYDAIRVYLWAGMMDPRDKLRGAVLNAIPAMNVYLAHHDAPPERVNEQGIPIPQDGPVGFSAAVMPYLRVCPNGAKLSALQLARMDKMRDAATGLFGKDLAYYDQNLALFANGFAEGRFRFGSGGELTVQWGR